VAVYFLNLKTFGRSGGSSAVSAAAYRSGERIRDERTGKTYDHTDRQDVLHKEILVPSRFAPAELSWAKDRANLWNQAEGAESRKNARVAREYLVALPVELDAQQRIELARGFSQELSDRYQFAVDLAVHAPREYPGSDPRNFHAHLLATTREVTREGLAAKTALELSDGKRRELGLKPVVHELLHVRERWATVTNQALEVAHIDARVDHRTLAAQGIDREPYPYISRAAFEMERHGYRSAEGDRRRSEYESRVQAREQSRLRGARLERDGAEPVAPEPAARPAFKPLNLEEVRRQAREEWLRHRSISAETSRGTDKASGAEASRVAPERSKDDGFTL
jgi:ATP-dependent exoDNAse (exonuclease V) alpha subunit